MKEKIAKLINVKTIVTIAVTGVFVYLSATGKIPVEQFMLVITMIYGFYFGTQHEKKAGDKND